MTEQQTPDERPLSAVMNERIRARAGHAPAEPEAEQEQTKPTDFDGGVRTNAPRPRSMNEEIRRAAGVTR